MACVPASYVDLECKHLFESADVAAAGAQGCSCDSLVYVYLRREQDGVHCLSNLTKIKNNIGNVYSSHCVHIHHVYSSPCVHIHHVCSSTSFVKIFPVPPVTPTDILHPRMLALLCLHLKNLETSLAA